MPALSVYAFDRSTVQEAGPFRESHASYACENWTWASWWNMPGAHAVLAMSRPDNEDVIDLSAAANNMLSLQQIDGLIQPAFRKGPVRTTYRTWDQVPLFQLVPSWHDPSDWIAVFSVDYFATTPWYCTAVDGTIDYYVFFALDGNGSLTASVNGGHYTISGGLACHDGAKKQVDDGVKKAFQPLGNLLNAAVQSFAKGRTFSTLYYLPGHGARSGSGVDDADSDIALAVIPN